MNLSRETDEKLDWCSHPPRPPCAAYVSKNLSIKLEFQTYFNHSKFVVSFKNTDSWR